MIDIGDFEQIDIRVGRIVRVEPFAEGKHSSHILRIDFGESLGIKKSLARLHPNYAGSELIDRQVVCVVNLPPRQIQKHRSEVLTLGVPDADGNVALLEPDREVPLGGRVY